MNMMLRQCATIVIGIAALDLTCLLVGASAAAAEPETGTSETPTVRVAQGALTGAKASGIYHFKGVPYAAPPVGALRWRAPQPPEPWEGVRDARAYGPACPLDTSWRTAPGTPMSAYAEVMLPEDFGPTSEDCLQLNVWTTSLDEDSKLPVMVWIHGGGHYSGTSHIPMYDGTNLAKRGVVLVSIKYRLGRLGFFAHPALISEASRLGEPTGNYGIMDQIAALEWVKANIAAFGGNPERVTIFGESGGGRSVNWLMTSPLSEGLFEGAISQSGRALQPLRHITEKRMGLEPMSRIDERVIARLGVEPTVEAMRALPTEEMVPDFRELLRDGFGPFIDGTVIPDDPGLVFAAGGQHDVPFIIGSNGFEGNLLQGRLSPEQLLAAAKATLGEAYAEADKLYGFSSRSQTWSVIDFIQDSVHLNSSRFLAAGMSGVEASVWLYHFNYVPKFKREDQPRGALHGDELIYVFDNLDASRRADEYSDDDHRIAEIMSDYWVSFARDGDPNVPRLPYWPPYTAEKDELLYFDNEVKAIADFRKSYVDFNERLYRRTMGLPPMAD
jgi:para-nitrobenzyl esterase